MTERDPNARDTIPYLLGHILERWNGLGQLHKAHSVHSLLMERLDEQYRTLTPDRNPPEPLKRLIGNLLDRWNDRDEINRNRAGDELVMRQIAEELAKIKETAQ